MAMAAFDFKPGHAMLDAQNLEAAIEFFGGALQQHIEKHGDMDPRRRRRCAWDERRQRPSAYGAVALS